MEDHLATTTGRPSQTDSVEMVRQHVSPRVAIATSEPLAAILFE